jgi:signal transduction histidine kinase
MECERVSQCSVLSANREAIHDLRNLFGIVASARHMLDDGPSKSRQAMLLGAIDKAVERGDALTTTLLAQDAQARSFSIIDLAERLNGLAPMLEAACGRDLDLIMNVGARHFGVRVEPLEFDAIIVELVTNARAAMGRRGRIIVRVRSHGTKVRVLIADEGGGMSVQKLASALRGGQRRDSHGTGLRRVRSFLELSDGRMDVRSRPGHGTVIRLTLPLAPKPATAHKR